MHWSLKKWKWACTFETHCKTGTGLMRKQDASQWVLCEVNVPFFWVVNSSVGGCFFSYSNSQALEDSAKLCSFWEIKQMQMDPWALKNTVFCVQYNKSKLFIPVVIRFSSSKAKASLSMPLNFKKLNSTSKFQDFVDSIYLIQMWNIQFCDLFFVKLIKSFANLNVGCYLP